ncbi:NAD(P)/FAD-dependent oxidoreductase [Pseudalkalibacillus decolorationis]|uniref:NAD(P)/FAD-dependent oxidoreductase n=1 Tax=Pseudalkalibacillus decolorationis TaxID=163879 RepID=UPI0021499639
MKDCLIIGAGPAGLSAAISAAQNGVDVTVIDEFMKPGGRLLGQLHEEPDHVWWNGIEEAQKLFDEVLNQSIDLKLGTSVYHIEKANDNWLVHTNEGIYRGKTLLVAAGAAERSIPIPGWTLPGVMSIGAAQVMTNVHQVKPGHNGIVIGINVLSLAIARELQLAGVHLQGIVLPPEHLLTKGVSHPMDVFQSLLHLTHLAPSPLLKWGGLLAGKSAFIQRLSLQMYPKNGFKLWNISVQMKRVVTEIVGHEQVQGVKTADLTASGDIVPGSERTIPVDFVCIAGGLYPLVELVGVAGCPFKYIPSLGGHVPIHDERMKTPVDGLFVAGNITGIESAKVAKAQGHLAGLSISEALGKLTENAEIKRAIEHIEKTREKALIQFHPDIKKGRKHMETIAADFQKKEVSGQ